MSIPIHTRSRSVAPVTIAGELKNSQKKKELDILASKACRLRDGYVCKKCGKQQKSAQAAHIFTRSNLNTRWDLSNLITMCYHCHIHWGHRNPVEFTEWVKEMVGIEEFEELKKKSLKAVSSYLNDERYREIKSHLMSELDKYNKSFEEIVNE